MDLFDYIVVGGGSAGCVLAARLSEDAHTQVALIEAGPADKSVLIHCPAGIAVLARNGQLNWAFPTTPQAGLNGRRSYQPRGKVLGGSSSINAMIYLRGQAQDYDDWAAAGNPGWSFDEVLPYFKRAEHNERGADDWHGEGGPLNVADLRDPNAFGNRFVQAGVQAGYAHNTDFNAASQDGVGTYQVTHRNGERFSAAKAYLTPAMGRPNLRVITGALTTRILFEGRRAVGVAFIERGTLRELRAHREVLLSAGALQSPQLLQLSGVGDGAALQRQGLPVVHHLPGVGANLQDHIDVVQVVHVPGATDLFGISLKGTGKLLSAIGQWRNKRRGMLTTNFAESGGFVRSSADETRPDLQFHFVIGKLVDHGRKTVLGHGYSCHVCVLRPKSRGSVSLANADPRSAPQIDPQFLSDDDDTRRLVAGFKLMRNILRQPALADVKSGESATSVGAQSDAEIEAFIRQHADTVYHPVGTCRMGHDADAVVDANLRVHGVQGLRVVDASIMPAIVSGNINAPVIMIAEKAVDMIRADAAAHNSTKAQP